MIKQHVGLQDGQALYECRLYGRLYGIIGHHNVGSCDNLIKLLLERIPLHTEMVGSSFESLILNIRNHNDPRRALVFKVLCRPGTLKATCGYGVYPHNDISATALGCYIKNERYFGDPKDIRRLDITSVYGVQLIDYV